MTTSFRSVGSVNVQGLITNVVLGATVGLCILAASYFSVQSSFVPVVIGSCVLAFVLPWRDEWFAALVIGGLWPLVLLGSGRAGVGFVVIGLFAQVRWMRSASGADRILIIPSAIATLWLILAGFPADQVELQRALTLYAVGMTALLVGSTSDMSRIGRPTAVLLLPILVMESLFSDSLPFVNPIVLGHLGWMGVVLAIGNSGRLPLTLRALLVGFGAWTTQSQPSLGPLISASIAIGFVFVSGYRWKGNASIAQFSLRRSVTLTLAPFVIAVVGYAAATQFTSEAQRFGGSFSSRTETWALILNSSSVVGRGLGAVTVGDVAELGHAHNFLLDALFSGGVFFFAAVSLLTIFAFRFLFFNIRYPADIRAIALGIVVAKLFSGSLAASPEILLVLGLAIQAGRRSLKRDQPSVDGVLLEV